MGCGGQRRVPVRQPRLTRCKPDCRSRSGRDEEERQQKLEATRIDSDGRDQSDRKRNPRPAPEGEVERRHQHHERGCARRASDDTAGAGREADRQEPSDSAEDREAVPVPDGLGEAIDGLRLEDADPIRKHARREAEGGNSGDPNEETAQELPDIRAR